MYHYYGDQPRLQLALRRYSLQGPGARGMSLLETSSYFSNALVYYLSFSKLHASIICQGIVCVGVVCSKTSRFSIAVIIMHC